MSILPKDFRRAHELCFVIHDIMAQIIKSGEEQKIFTAMLNLNEEEKLSINDDEDILDWLQLRKRFDDRNLIIRSTVLPGILSDMMHCVYEALSASSKGKMTVAFMLIRKPIQESLYVLESMIIDEEKFVNDLETKPQLLQPSSGGGVEGHTKRVSRVLEKICMGGVLDPKYIAQLRYDKKEYDSFDGLCNKAMHLFTRHEAIKTESMNINFIFSGAQQLPSQWEYFYTRLPYLLLYTYFLVEYILEKIKQTPEAYLSDIFRRITSSYVIASLEVPDEYSTEESEKLVELLHIWLIEHCTSHGHSQPNFDDLVKMSQSGSFPNETEESIKKRMSDYEIVNQ
ncbi:MAG: hypothetical protein V7784_03000 [Oceanospirillaceae bacterium]